MKLTAGKLSGLNAVSNERGVIAAAAMAIRNPAVLASVVGALLNKKRPGKAKF